jgi:hypothetical protein
MLLLLWYINVPCQVTRVNSYYILSVRNKVRELREFLSISQEPFFRRIEYILGIKVKYYFYLWVG